MKERKSKFFGYAFPVQNEEEVKEFLEQLKKKYPTANHVCYAWQMGINPITYRANDDGEPNNSAAMPIYGQLQSFNVTNTMVAVVRIFGGTKLGVGGLISAYRECAKLTLVEANIVTRILKKILTISFNYQEMEYVMRIIKQEQLEIKSQHFEISCKIELYIPKKDFKNIVEIFKSNPKLTFKITG